MYNLEERYQRAISGEKMDSVDYMDYFFLLFDMIFAWVVSLIAIIMVYSAYKSRTETASPAALAVYIEDDGAGVMEKGERLLVQQAQPRQQNDDHGNVMPVLLYSVTMLFLLLLTLCLARVAFILQLISNELELQVSTMYVMQYSM